MWSEALRLALSLGLPPDAFWRLSLKEWRMLTEVAAAPVLGRGGFEQLLARYPDLDGAHHGRI